VELGIIRKKTADGWNLLNNTKKTGGLINITNIFMELKEG